MNKSHSVVLKSHIDKFCGEYPNALFKEKLTGVTVARFDNIPEKGLTTFISLGLSAHALSQNSGPDIRQELLITVENEYSQLAIEEIIFSVATLMLEKHTAVMQGQVLGPRGLLFPEDKKSKLTSILCSYPAFFPEEFSFFDNDETTVFVELILISTIEAELIQEAGWSMFFDQIDEGEVNILNFHR